MTLLLLRPNQMKELRSMLPDISPVRSVLISYLSPIFRSNLSIYHFSLVILELSQLAGQAYRATED